MYKCDKITTTPECKNLVEYSELNKYCDDNNYDFSRDGLHVKDRTEPLFDLPTIPQNLNGKPWYDMDLFKDTNNSYELKNNNDIENDYNRNRKSELF